MDKKIKNFLGVAIIVGIGFLAFSAKGFVEAYSRAIDPSSLRSFSVSGEGRATAVPDVAKIMIGVIAEKSGESAISDIQKENVKKMNAIIDFLRSKGVMEKDIKTQNYSITPQYTYYGCGGAGPCPPAKITGYKISQDVAVKIRNFEKIGEILGGAADKGANTVSGLQFAIDDPEKIESEARAEAIKKAKIKAEAVAEAGGFRVGKIISIDENGFRPTPIFAKAADFSEDATGAVPEIMPGEDEVVVAVSVRYEIR